MKTLIASAALALAFTAPAFANDQLAASLGVDAGQYTLSELAQIKAAQESDDNIGFPVFSKNDTSFSTRGVSAGYVQLAASLGVEPGQYTLSQLAQIKANQDSDDSVIFVVSSKNDVAVSTRNTIFAGHAQLAASLGVDAGEYSLTDIARMIADRDSDDGVN